jgi:type VI secretion system protein VasD
LKSVFRHRLLRVAGPVLAAAALVAACAKAPVIEPPPPPPPPVSVVVEAVAAADVNPDVEGRPSPVIVRIYQLADDAAFGKAEFFPLWNQEAQTLAAAAVGQHEMRLVPGGDGEYTFKLDPQVRSIGVAAAYRDFRNVTWKTSVAIPDQPVPGSTIRLVVGAGSGAVTARWQ